MTALAQKARLSVVWTTGLNVMRDTLQFGMMLLLVRLLPAAVYGQFGLMNTIIGFMMVFSSRECLAHTLLIRDDKELNYQEQFTAGCVIQGTLFVCANLVALVLWHLPTYAPMAPLLHAMSGIFLIDLPSELRIKMLERSLDWRRLRTIEGIGVLIAAALTLTLAFAGAGVYALCLPSYAIPCAFAIDLLLIERWRPSFSWNAARYRATREFGISRLFSNGFVNAASLLESGVLARAVGYTMLGVFGRAIGMGTLFCQRIASLLMTALYPVLARIPIRSEAYERVSALVLRTVVWLVIPVATIVSLLSDRIVRTLYGSKWLDAIPLVPWAMMVTACMAVVQAAYSLLLAHHESRRCLHADLWRLWGTGLALALALPFGLAAYLGAMFVVQAVALALVLFWLARSGGVRVSGMVAAVIPAAAASLLAALLSEMCRALVFGDLPTIPLMAVDGIVFGAAYLSCLRIFFPSLLHELVGYFPESGRMHRWLGFAEAA